MEYERGAESNQGKARSLRPAQRLVEIDHGESCKHWLGRGDAEPEEWDDLVARAIERREVPTENYLLDHPQLAEHWLDGMERLNLGGLVADTD